MILDGQCGQFNPVLLQCLEELGPQLPRMLADGMGEDKQYREAQRLSDEILRKQVFARKPHSLI